MGAAARIIHFAVLASTVGMGAGGCCSSGSQGTLLDQAESGSLAPVTFPCPRLVTPVAPPAGFSSTYQKYLMDRQQQARRAEQNVQARTPAKNPSENDARAQNR